MAEREKVQFSSAEDHCAAWHYAGTNSVCIVMAAGLAVVKEAGTDVIARRFNDAGFSVLAFDFRHLGESGGEPRQIVRIGEQIADFEAAIAYARTLPEVDPRRVAVWGFSLSGGHVYAVARRNPDLGAAISHSGLSDSLHTARYAVRYFTAGSFLKLNALAIADRIGRVFGRAPILIPLSGEKGEVASITTPDAQNGARALNPDGRYDAIFPMLVDAWSALRIGFYRPGRHARGIRPPLLVIEFQDDGVTPPGPAAKAAARAPRGELIRLPGGHYSAFLDQEVQDDAVAATVSFLHRQLLGDDSRERSELVAAPVV
jgi:pimeloyl-ACP methyl ester carboxylesterase